MSLFKVLNSKDQRLRTGNADVYTIIQYDSYYNNKKKRN